MPNLRAPEIILILLVVLLLFGAKRLPDLAKSVGKSLKILKTEVRDNDEDRPSAAAPVPPAAPSSAPYVAPTAQADPQQYTQPYTPPAAYTPPSTAAPADTNDRKQV